MHVVQTIDEFLPNDPLGGPAVLIGAASVAGEPGDENRVSTAVGGSPNRSCRRRTHRRCRHRAGKYAPPDQQVQTSRERVVVPDIRDRGMQRDAGVERHPLQIHVAEARVGGHQELIVMVGGESDEARIAMAA